MGFFSKGLKNEFEIAVVNEPSVFESLKFYCTYTKQKYVETSTPEKKGNREILQIFSIFLNIKKKYVVTSHPGGERTSRPRANNG